MTKTIFSIFFQFFKEEFGQDAEIQHYLRENKIKILLRMVKFYLTHNRLKHGENMLNIVIFAEAGCFMDFEDYIISIFEWAMGFDHEDPLESSDDEYSLRRRPHQYSIQFVQIPTGPLMNRVPGYHRININHCHCYMNELITKREQGVERWANWRL